MKCKECREKIPDNVKYCPECGALVNEHGGSYRYNQNYTGNDRQEREETPKVSFQGFPQKKRTLRGIPFIRILLFIFIFICAGSVLFSSLGKIAYWGDTDVVWDESVSVESFEVFDDAEYFASEYVANVVDCDAFQSTDTFRTQTLLDWDQVCRDYYRSRPEDGSTASVVNEEELYAKSENCLRAVFKNINSRYEEDFEPFNFYIDTIGMYSLSAEQSTFYHILISSYLNGIGLDAENYYDRYDISNLYCVDFSVTAEDENFEKTHEFGNIQVIIAEIYDEYYVLYDDVYIQTFLDTIN